VIGETVGNFEIVSRLGKGGMGEVWLAQQKNIKTKVAIKMLQADISTNTTHVQRFFNEAVAVSQIHHSGIVKIFDVGFHTGGEAYLVMEYLEGETLTSRIQKFKRLPMAQVADFGRQIASVLDATHSADITHRDLKPENIYLVRDAELANGERIKVLDFGIAKLIANPNGPRMTSLSVSNIGTPNYMSPEQWHSLAEVDWRTDAYALGCVAFEMACGRPPFIGESMADVCAQHLGEPPPVPSKLVPGLPPAFDDIVARLLEKEPSARPTMRETMAVFTALGMDEGQQLMTIPPTGMRSPLATGEPLAKALAEAAAQQPLTAPSTSQAIPIPPVSSSTPARPRRRLGLFIALGALAIGGTVAAAVVISSSSSSGPGPASSADPVRGSNTAVATTTSPSTDAAEVVLLDAAAAPAPLDAAAVATAPLDAAVVADAPVVAVVADAAVVAPDAQVAPVVTQPIRIATLPKRTAGKDPVLRDALTLDICIDKTGAVTRVTSPKVRDAVMTWKYEPHLEHGKPTAACAKVTLPKEVGFGSVGPAPALKAGLTRAQLDAGIEAVRDEVMRCDRGTVGRSIAVTLTIAPAGTVSAAKAAVPSDDLARCIETTILRHARFPKTTEKSTTVARFKFVKADDDSSDDGGDY